jgi:hypothetical protein
MQQTAKALDQSLVQAVPQTPAARPVAVKDAPDPEVSVDADPELLDERNERSWVATMIDSVRQPGLPVDLLTGQLPPLER